MARGGSGGRGEVEKLELHTAEVTMRFYEPFRVREGLRKERGNYEKGDCRHDRCLQDSGEC